MMKSNKTNMSCIGVVTIASLALIGCTTSPSDCDPAQGGYLRAIGCSASGAYDHRQKEKYSTLQYERTKRHRLENEYRDALAEQRSVHAQRGSNERRYASLQNDLRQLESRLAKSGGVDASLNQTLSDLKSEASMLEQDTFTPEVEKAARLDQLMREKAALEREIEMALRR